MIRQTMCRGILLAAAGLGLPIGALAGCATGNPPVQNGTTAISYPTIQAAINGASPGDTIIVSPGTYNDQLIVNKAGLILRSSKGPSVTCVQRPSDGAVITVSAANVVIGGHDAGFTIQDKPGAVLSGGTGIYFDNASPNGSAIDNVIHLHTTVSGDLIGINAAGSNALIADNDIEPLQSDAGNIIGVRFSGDSARITHNIVRSLNTTYGNVFGILWGGAYSDPAQGTFEITENVISDLAGEINGAVSFSSSRVTDLLIRDNNITRVISACGCGVYGVGLEVPVADVRMFENSISSVTHGDNFVLSGAGSHINFNNFSGTLGLDGGGSGVDATNNYWGCPGGPGSAGCDVTFGTKFKPFAPAPFDLSVPPLNP